MANSTHDPSDDAWYAEDRPTFVRAGAPSVVDTLSASAVAQGWHVEPSQHQEWAASVELLHKEFREVQESGVSILQSALAQTGLSAVSDVVLEYNLRRRGLRIDCVLLAPGLILIVEFKRSTITAADRDQVINYCVNLLEFHEETRRSCDDEDVIVVPVLCLTAGKSQRHASPKHTVEDRFFDAPWGALLRRPVECDSQTLQGSLELLLQLRRGSHRPDRKAWVGSRFSPSSTILDAAISLYGQHEVSAIRQHAAPVGRIEECIEEVAANVQTAQRLRENRIIFVSGAPGAGKTLVGLRLAFDSRFRRDSVFVTGNAPLVDVLTAALKQSYTGAKAKRAAVASGYPRASAGFVIENSLFKIVKAHNFLGERGKHTASSDGRIVVFDEAQRTYEKGRVVLQRPLPDHEADLILASLETSYGDGVVVVALIGQNQAINRGERGAIAWLEAAGRRGWKFAVSEQTFALPEFLGLESWLSHKDRLPLTVGHLSDSLRFYRNKSLEQWTHGVLEEDAPAATQLADQLREEGHTIWYTRDLQDARRWVRAHRVGDERGGLIASGQARRLAAEGLFVDLKPPIANWMLNPSGDVRASNMLETVQNQYQIQGLELDYCIVCWDADLRREKGAWRAYKMSGPGWQVDKALDIAKNSYRVLLTRARKGMVIFIPQGDPTGEDTTRDPEFYDGIASYLAKCGVQQLERP